MTTLFTIGYEQAGMGAFLDTLRRAGVRTVIDVRDLPLSRRAGFSKNVLAASLAEAGIGYVHLKNLGTPKEGRLAARRGDYATFWSIFSERMATPEAAFDLQKAAEITQREPACLLCFEADPAKCHRRKVAEALVEGWGFAVEDLRVEAP
jgi:uncharacterized protein (DUF488 family)